MVGDVIQGSSGRRLPIERIGATVLKSLVETIVSGEVKPGEALVPEATLSDEFGVSRTVIRESVKRLQEKGMVTVAQGRGTHVNPMSSWNLMDPLVISALIGHDDALGILDDLSVVRGTLEGVMAGAVAADASDGDLALLRENFAEMQSVLDDSALYREADVRFHLLVMKLSGNILAENIAHGLFERALESSRYHGIDPEHAFEITHEEHQSILDAITAHDEEAARRAMESHILESWRRRRLSTKKL
ncbi:FadR/GntR family transcriptional regulator (plasmid) [Coraliomargarita sp. W4R53]